MASWADWCAVLTAADWAYCLEWQGLQAAHRHPGSLLSNGYAVFIQQAVL